MKQHCRTWKRSGTFLDARQIFSTTVCISWLQHNGTNLATTEFFWSQPSGIFLCAPAVSESCLWFMHIDISKITVMTEIQSRLSVALIMAIKKKKKKKRKGFLKNELQNTARKINEGRFYASVLKIKCKCKKIWHKPWGNITSLLHKGTQGKPEAVEYAKLIGRLVTGSFFPILWFFCVPLIWTKPAN